MKTKTIPFDLETAKKIQAGEIEGRIKTGPKEADVTIISFNRKGPFSIVGLISGYIVATYNTEGYSEDCANEVTPHRLCIEVHDNEPQFKPFDKVLVRDNDCDQWRCALFSHKSDVKYNASALYWNQCIPYEGNQELVGTTKTPKDYEGK